MPFLAGDFHKNEHACRAEPLFGKTVFLLPGRQADTGGSFKCESQREQEYENAGQEMREKLR